jgi:phospholipid/cholesterol/gamma-HCH transport system permease protein
MKRMKASLAYVGGATTLLFEALLSAVKPPYRFGAILQEIEAIGIQSLTVVNVIAFFTGMVLALQTAYALSRFGAKSFIGVVVAMSLVREIGPVFTGIMVAGRVGSGIAAEIGTMKVTEQIDAIRVMGANPVKTLVMPKLIAAIVSLPLLTILDSIALQDVASGVGKTFFFGLIIAVIGCHEGMSTSGGTVGVGRATTTTVVVSSILILISDFFLTKIFLTL